MATTQKSLSVQIKLHVRLLRGGRINFLFTIDYHQSKPSAVLIDGNSTHINQLGCFTTIKNSTFYTKVLKLIRTKWRFLLVFKLDFLLQLLVCTVRLGYLWWQ